MSEFIEISKKQARERYDDGKIIRLMASNLKPNGYWGEPLPILSNGRASFEAICNGFAYHNCTKETGKTIKFYIKEDDK